MLRGAVERAKLGNEERLAAMRRLDAQARTLERAAGGASSDALVAEERALSERFGGRTVMDDRRPKKKQGQLELPLARK